MNQAHANTATLAVAGVSKTLGGVQLFKDVNLQLQQGESLAVVGESGSGKSTLLHLMAALDQPDTGEVYWAGKNICTLNTNQVAAIRLRHVGLVFQAYYLMPHLSSQQNVELPFLLAGQKPDSAHASLLLEQVGMAHKANSFPREMSGGEQQRVAIARALALNPPLILADEPTGNLDPETSKEIMELLLAVAKEENTAILMATHDMQMVQHYPGRILEVMDGKLVERN